MPGTRAQERTKRLLILTACRPFVGEPLPTAVELGAMFGVNGGSVQRALHKLAGCGLITLRRVTIPGSRRPLGGNPSTTRPITRLLIERICTDDEFNAAHPLPRVRRVASPKAQQLPREKLMVIVRMSHNQKRLMPPYMALGKMTGMSHTTAHKYVQEMISAGVIKVRHVERGSSTRLFVTDLAP